MRIDVVSIFPQMFDAIIDYGISSQAIDKGLIDIDVVNPRDYAKNRHRYIDDRPYGGGPGMLMSPQPLADAIDAARERQRDSHQHETPVIYLSPQGDQLTQPLAFELSKLPGLVLVSGRYEGIDERIVDSRIDREISIGDYVLAGGELPAMVLIETIIRLLPDVLGSDLSAEQDSFSTGLLDCQHYTRPEEFEGQTVPSELLSGNHEMIRKWRLKQSLGRTWLRRPELLTDKSLNSEEIELLKLFQLENENE